jgi:hypothetical protein
MHKSTTNHNDQEKSQNNLNLIDNKKIHDYHSSMTISSLNLQNKADHPTTSFELSKF